MDNVAALYVETNGVYFGLPGVDHWDEPREHLDTVIAYQKLATKALGSVPAKDCGK